jgi:hypothetical protein
LIIEEAFAAREMGDPTGFCREQPNKKRPLESDDSVSSGDDGGGDSGDDSDD